LAYGNPDGFIRGITEKSSRAVSDLTGFALVVIGAGSGAAIAEVVKSWLPEQTAGLTDEAIAAAAGFAMFYFGERIHPRLVSFGFGLFLSAIGAMTSSFTAGIIAMLTKK